MPSITSEATFDLGGLSDPIRFCGYRDQNLNALEALVPVVLRLDGDRVHLSGDQRAVRRAEAVLAAMLAAARAGAQVTPDDVALAARGSGRARDPADARGDGARARGAAEDRRSAGARRARSTPNTLTFAIGPGRHGQDVPRDRDGGARAQEPRGRRGSSSRARRSRPARSSGFCRAISKRKSIRICARSTTRCKSCSRTGRPRSISSAGRSRSRRSRTCAAARWATRS